MSVAKDTLVAQLAAARLPAPVRDLRFHPLRLWCFDVCWPSRGIAAEVEQGDEPSGHAVYNQDARKYNEAARLGWLVFRFTPDMVASGEAAHTLEAVLRTR